MNSGTCVMPPSPEGYRRIVFRNILAETVWVGLFGDPPPDMIIPDKWDWSVPSGECRLISIKPPFSGRAWARSHCVDMKGTFVCRTGDCLNDKTHMCTASGESPATLVEWTMHNDVDFYDVSAVDGYSVPIRVKAVNGTVFGTGPLTQCNEVALPKMDILKIPPELRVYGDAKCPQATCSISGINEVSSPCYITPNEPACQAQLIGARSICKALDCGWIAYFIANAPNSLATDKWKAQFTNDKTCTDASGKCNDNPAIGTLDRNYAPHTMFELVCAAGTFACSPYTDNQKMFTIASDTCNESNPCTESQSADTCGCNYLGNFVGFNNMTPTFVKDQPYPQCIETKRHSSQTPDWPESTIPGVTYGTVFDQGKEGNDSANKYYTWQFNDSASTIQCINPDYIVTFGDTSSPINPSTNGDGHEKGALSTAAVVGIVVGVVALLLATVVVVWYMKRKVKIK